MKFFATPLITLTLCLGALGAAVQMRAPHGKASGVERCPSAYIVTTQLIQAGGITVNRSTYACPDNALREAAQTPLPTTKKIPRHTFDRRGTLGARNAAECRNPAPECQCSQSCEHS